jgi:hypothetical protein
MIAILAESEMNRRHLSMISGHNGVIAFNMVYGTKNATHHPPSSVRLMRDGTALQVECLSEVLCSKNTVTDSRGIDGMRSCQAASASALRYSHFSAVFPLASSHRSVPTRAGPQDRRDRRADPCGFRTRPDRRYLSCFQNSFTCHDRTT